MTVIQKTIGRLPVNLGDYNSTRAYGKKNRVLLYGCEWESKVNNNTYAPAALNTTTGVITPDTTHWKLISGSYNTWLIDNGYQKMAASNVKDSNLNDTQDNINASIIGEIGSDSSANTIKGRIKDLETSVGSGGSVDERIAAEGAQHYLKSETYTKSEVNGMITTPDQGFVSVEATTQTTAATDVLPATGEADTIYRVGNWNGSQYDTTCYTEYTWNTTTSAYVKLSTKNVGVDEKPTAGSENLVKSGGAFVSILDVSGIIDKGTTYNQKDATNRVCVYYDIPDVDATYKIKLSDVSLSDSSNSVYLAIRSGKTPYSATVLAAIGFGNYKGNAEVEFTIPAAVKAQATCIAVTQYDADGTASFKVALQYNALIDHKIAENREQVDNTNTLIPITGSNGTYILSRFTTQIGQHYSVVFPKEWTIDFAASQADDYVIFTVRKIIDATQGTYENVDGTYITKGTFNSKKPFVGFDATGELYELFVRADDSQYLPFMVIPNGEISRQEIDEIERKIDDVYERLTDIDFVIDKGTTYNEKYGTTNRTCAFYDIPNLDSTYRINVSNVTLPQDVQLYLAIRSDKTPYSASFLSIIGQGNYSGATGDIEFSIPQAVKSQAKYISVIQWSASSDLCQFTVKLLISSSDVEVLKGQISNLDNRVEKLEKGELSVDVIPYNDEVFDESAHMFVKIYNPYKNGGSNQYTGQTHCHTWTQVNGEKVPLNGGTDVADGALKLWEAMAAEGYDFMFFTDYGYFDDITLKPSGGSNDMTFLCGAYENANSINGGVGQHMVIFNTNEVFNTPNMMPQEIIDLVTPKNHVAVLAHPYWKNLFQTEEKIATIKKDCRFIEIFSGLNFFNEADGSETGGFYPGYADKTDYGLDVLISQGNFTFGLAVSDSHSLGWQEINGRQYRATRTGCIKVFANAIDRASILKAMLEGNFYACTYIDDTINGVSVENGMYKVNVGVSGAIVKFMAENYTTLATVTTGNDGTASYAISSAHKFIRANITLPNGDIVWTQPVFIATELL